MNLLSAVFAQISPSGDRARLPVLIFHRVLPQPDPLFPDEVDARRFDAICGWLRQWFRVLPLDEAVQRLRAGELPARAACITFDDGYADNCTQALPILQRHGLTATFFIATGFLDGGRMWNDTLIEALREVREDSLLLRAVPGLADQRVDLSSVVKRRQAVGELLMAVKYLEPAVRQQAVDRIAGLAGQTLPTDLMMTSTQVRHLHASGMTVGAHTVTHPILATLDVVALRTEIRGGRDHLQQLLQAPVRVFAYPNGKPGSDYGQAAVDEVRDAGFSVAVSTRQAVAARDVDPLQVPRFTPWDRGRVRFALRLARQFGST